MMSILAGNVNSFIAEISSSAGCEDCNFFPEKIVNVKSAEDDSCSSNPLSKLPHQENLINLSRDRFNMDQTLVANVVPAPFDYVGNQKRKVLLPEEEGEKGLLESRSPTRQKAKTWAGSPGCLTVLEVRVSIPQSTSILVVGCSPDDVIVPQGVSPKPPTQVLRNLNQEKTEASSFE
ncbi:hypothetical protein TNCV_1993891 [Trichonephila clavipes]|nr:hypothetical protein TNCV_1993891 [Trichonephila clavipes]